MSSDDSFYNDDDFMQLGKKPNAYKITIDEAYISKDDIMDPGNIKELEEEIFYSVHTKEYEIFEDIYDQIKEISNLGAISASVDSLVFSYKLIKEDYKTNINSDCLKVALKCYNIDFDGDFYDLLKNKEILNKIGFYNVYGNIEFGNIKTNNKILLYDGYAIAVNTDFRRNIKNKRTTKIITYKEFNDKINICKSKNIPQRCFNNKKNKGSIEIFESDSDFNKYDKTITGSWIKYKYIINDSENIKLQTMDREYIDMMKEAREEFIKLSAWFDNKIIEQCKIIYSRSKVRNNDEYINKNKFDIIPPVFPYGYRNRYLYSRVIRGDEYYARSYNSINMDKACLTAFKEMKKIYCISNIPIKESMERYWDEKYIIFVKSDIVYNGFYPSNAINLIKSIDKKATFEYYRIYQTFDINTEDITIKNYKIVFGMLINEATKYKYIDETNTYIKDIRADYDYNTLLHLNIMIKRNTIILREIATQYKVNNVLPVGYEVDSILYDSDDNIKKAQTKYFKDVGQVMKYDDIDIKYNQKYNYHFGVSGSGKSTKLMESYRDNEVVIVNTPKLYNMYRDKNINVILWQRFLNEHQPLYTTKIYIDDIFAFNNTDIEKIFYICNVNDIWVSLYGDYNLAKPFIGKTYIDNFNNCLKYVEHDYDYTNYRNTLEYNGKDSWIVDFDKFECTFKEKREEYMKKLIKAGFVKISNEGMTIRYHTKDAKENEKMYKGKYYIINNYGNKAVPSELKLLCQTDELYTKEELKGILGNEYNKYKRYFVNNNCISLLNIRQHTFKNINIINKETLDMIINKERIFYTFVSRFQGDINV